MNWILKIAPRKLKEIDINLREKYPSIWATRIHLTAYLGILLAGLTGLIGVITPVNTEDVLSQNDIETFFGLLIIPAVIYTGYIIIQLVLFNIEKRNGVTHKKTAWVTLPLIMASLLIPFLMPYTNSLVLSYKTANLKSDYEIIQQRDQLAKTKYFINGGISEYKYRPKKVLKYNYRTYSHPHEEYMYEYKDPFRDSIYLHGGIYKESRPRLKKHHDTYYFKWEIFGSNPIVTLDSLSEVFYDQQNASFNLETAKKHLDLGQTIITEYSKADVLDIDSIMYELKNNIYSNTYSYRKVLGDYSYKVDRFPADNIYNNAHNNIFKIIQAKNNWIPKDLREDFFPGLLLFMFCLAIVVFTFKWVSWQQFLINIFCIGLYFTIVAVLADVYRWRGDFIATMFIALMFISLIFVHRIWSRKKFSILNNQFAITAIYSAPFFPYFLFVYFKKVLKFFKRPYFDRYEITKYNADGDPYQAYSDEYYQMIESIEFWSFWGGVGFFVIFGLPYFYKVFKRLNALPKKK